MKVDDILVAVDGVNVKCKKLKNIKALIMSEGSSVQLTLVTPMTPTSKPTIDITTSGTVRSMNSSSSSNDMHQLGDTMTGTWRNKMKSLTFLKTKKSPSESLRKK